MSQSRSSPSAPTLSEDDIISVFLRIRPDDPARLVRASLVCKAWRRILVSPDFCRLYREFHRTPPMLGFAVSCWSLDSDYVSLFILTGAFGLSAGLDFHPPNWRAVDSRHGRMLLEVGGDDELSPSGYIVWDPITNGRWGVPFPRIDRESWTGAVLCAKEHCDHLGCHGHPFLVAMVGSSEEITSACVHASESGVWSDIIALNHEDYIDWSGHSILVGNTLYFPFLESFRVLQYKLGEQKLSVIDVPQTDWDEHVVFVSALDGVMVFAGLRGTRLFLWSAKAGALTWAQRKVIELEKLLPPRAFEPKPYDDSQFKPCVSGFAQGTIFLSTMAGLFTVDLNSGRTKKVAEVEMPLNVVPWMSFYTLDHARRMMPRP